MSSVSLQRGLHPIARSEARAPHAFRLGGWRIEPGLGRISTETTERVIEPKVMDVLVHLAARQGEVVSSDELIAFVWAGRPMGDNPVHRCVSILRRALGDDAHRPRYIGTIPKRGYRVVAPVETVAGARPWSDLQTRPIPACIDIAPPVPATSALRRDADVIPVPGAVLRGDGAVLEGVLRMAGREVRITAVLADCPKLHADGHVLQRLEIEHIIGVVRSIARDAASE